MSFILSRWTGGERRAPAGYTLIEVVVAIAVFSAMMLLAGSAMNQALRQYQGLVEKGLNFWEHAQKIWMDKSFHSVVDYNVNIPGYGWFPYFRGNGQGVSYVTLAPFAGDLPVVVWIRKESGEDGKARLVYYELPVYAKSYREIESDLNSGEYARNGNVKILENMDQVGFSFYGYDVRDGKHKWRDTFEGRETRQLPLLVRISYSRAGEERVFMYGIHVNSQYKRGYQEIYGK